MKVIKPGQTIGIIGGGQLGKMLALAGQQMGYCLAVLDPNPQACAFSVADQQLVAAFDDEAAVLAFAEGVDVLTYEFENIDADLLGRLGKSAYLPQGIDLLLKSQDRLLEKDWLQSIGLQTVPYRAVNDEGELKAALEDLSYPAILKTRRMGYDGKGQVMIRCAMDCESAAVQAIVEAGAILEGYCDYQAELSVMLVGDLEGQVMAFPPTYNEHINGILCASQVKTAADSQVDAAVAQLVSVFSERTSLVGLLGVECFLTRDGDLLINEVAPRPHNSGHYSIEACNFSQYDQHILAICGRLLPRIDLLTPCLMVNILGQHRMLLEEAMEKFPQSFYHIYGKDEWKDQRKMGHWVLTNPSSRYLSELWQEEPFFQQWRQAFRKGGAN